MPIAPETQTLARPVRRREPQSDSTPVILSMGLGLTSILALVLLVPSLDALSDPEEALVALFWAAGVAVALWFTLSLALLLAANRSSSGLLLHWSQRITMPITRNLAKSTLALGLVALPACGASNEAQPAMVLVESGVALDSIPATQLPASTSTAPPTSHPSSAPPIAAESSEPPDDANTSEDPANEDVETQATNTEQDTASLEASSHTVVQGENLWSIAKTRLAQTQASTPTNSQVGPYWAEVIEQNRASLRSGNVNLIYPGEVINLPAIEDIRTD